jgi:hypothetical protein
MPSSCSSCCGITVVVAIVARSAALRSGISQLHLHLMPCFFSRPFNSLASKQKTLVQHSLILKRSLSPSLYLEYNVTLHPITKGFPKWASNPYHLQKIATGINPPLVLKPSNFQPPFGALQNEPKTDERLTKPFSDSVVPTNAVYITFSQHTFKQPTKVQDCRYNHLRTAHIQKNSQTPNLWMKPPIWCAKEYTTLLLQLLLSLDMRISRRPNPWKLHQSLRWIKGVRKQTIKYMFG